MKLPMLFFMLLSPAGAMLPQEVTSASCRSNIEPFYDARPLTNLTPAARSEVIRIVLPELESQANASGYEPKDLLPDKLATLLVSKQIPGGKPGQKLMAISFNYPSACGNHGNCPTYLLSISSSNVYSLIKKQPNFGESVGGVWGVAVLAKIESLYPNLLFLSTVSGSEIAVACYHWIGEEYKRGCDEPCTQILAHPDQ